MRGIFTILTLFFCPALSLFSQSSVIISQYIETNSGTSPKGIEIFNVSGSDIVFSATNNLEVYKGINGASCASDGVNITSGTLATDGVWVIGTIDLTTYAITNGSNLSGATDKSFTFNGDDALQVYLGGVIQDEFGTCGIDPGSAWSGNGVSTANQNIQILSAISNGDTDGWADPSIRFETVSTDPVNDMTGFGNPPVAFNTPTIAVTPNTLSDFMYEEGSGPSAEQSFTVEGSNLTADITVSPSTNWEISTGSGMSFVATDPVTLTQTGGSVSNTTIYTRLKEGLSAGTYSGENITCASTGATTQNVAVSGSITIADNFANGDIIITEIMQNPLAVSDANGEWFEVYNTTGSAIDLNGWTISDNGSDAHTIGSSLVVSAGGYAVLGNDSNTGTNGGASVDYEYSSFTLANGDDEIILISPGSTEIDRVEYDGGPNWPDPDGASMSLNNGSFAGDNNDGANWCEGVTSYGDGDKGTPGSTNNDCTTLAVEMNYFYAQLINNQVELSWTTVKAFNSDHFTLEWSLDGFDFHTLAHRIEVINTREDKTYEFVHNDPVKGINYYRLAEVDRDGRKTVFPVKSILIEKAAIGFVLQPNRVDNRLKVLFGAPVDNGRLQVYNTSGQLVMNQVLSNGIDVLNTDVSGLLPGQYVVRYVHAGGIETGRFVKM